MFTRGSQFATPTQRSQSSRYKLRALLPPVIAAAVAICLGAVALFLWHHLAQERAIDAVSRLGGRRCATVPVDPRYRPPNRYNR